MRRLLHVWALGFDNNDDGDDDDDDTVICKSVRPDMIFKNKFDKTVIFRPSFQIISVYFTKSIIQHNLKSDDV